MRKPAGLLTEEQQNLMRLHQLCRVFALTDSTLASRRIDAQVMSGGMAAALQGAPAASDGRVVMFNADIIKDVRTADGLVVVNGLNYHELAHILFTPNKYSEVTKSVIADKTRRAFNILEDQRIETLLTTQYPSVAAYLIATVAEYFVNVDKSRHNDVWPYLYGRKYLPAEMRRYFRNLYNKQDATKCREVEDIVREYVHTNVHAFKNLARVRHLIKEFARLTGDMNEFMPFGHQHADSAAASGDGAPEDTAIVLAELQEEGEGAAGEEGEGEEGTGKGSDGDGEGETGESEGEGGDDPEDADDGQPGGKQAGKGHGGFDADPIQALNDVAQNAKASEIVVEDIKHQREAMGDGKHFKPGLERIPSKGLRTPSREAVIASKKFAAEIQRLVADIDPGWHTHNASGRINPQRLMRGDDRDSVFDTWDAGKFDADSIEAVVMVDVSGSMAQLVGQASEAMWAIKNGIEQGSGNSRCTVIAFTEDAKYVYTPGEKMTKGKMKVMGSSGSTDPGLAAFECLRIFQNSKKRRKIAMFVTDGYWADSWTGGGGMMGGGPYRTRGAVPARGAHESISLMNAHGIVTACIFLDDSLPSNPEKVAELVKTHQHGCQIGGAMSAPMDLVAIAKKIVKASIKS